MRVYGREKIGLACVPNGYHVSISKINEPNLMAHNKYVICMNLHELSSLGLYLQGSQADKILSQTLFW